MPISQRKIRCPGSSTTTEHPHMRHFIVVTIIMTMGSEVSVLLINQTIESNGSFLLFRLDIGKR